MSGKIRRITESAAKAKAQELLNRAGHESAQLYEAARWQAVPILSIRTRRKTF